MKKPKHKKGRTVDFLLPGLFICYIVCKTEILFSHRGRKNLVYHCFFILVSCLAALLFDLHLFIAAVGGVRIAAGGLFIGADLEIVRLAFFKPLYGIALFGSGVNTFVTGAFFGAHVKLIAARA